MSGRPRQFSNAAEKQKAYRERKKEALAQIEALRNAPPAKGTREYWQKISDESEREHWRLIGLFITPDQYDQWTKDVASNHARYVEAQHELYMIRTDGKGVFAWSSTCKK